VPVARGGLAYSGNLPDRDLLHDSPLHVSPLPLLRVMRGRYHPGCQGCQVITTSSIAEQRKITAITAAPLCCLAFALLQYITMVCMTPISGMPHYPVYISIV
jgi:hypothetical protein